MQEEVTAYKSYLRRYPALAPAVARPLPVAALAAAAAVTAWTRHGSIAAHDWLPLAVLAALVLATVAAAGSAVRPARLAVVGVGALVLLAGWTAASLAWSPTPAGARDEALLTGLYAVVLLVPLVSLPRPRERDAATAWVVSVLAVLGVATAVRFAVGANPASLLFGGRLNFPITYVNAAAAVFAIGFWPAVVLAARRAWPIVARAGALAAASLFLALVVAAQSKGALLGVAASTFLVAVLAPARLRLLTAAVLAAAPAAAAVVPLTAPFRSSTQAAAHRPGWAALGVVAVGGVLGLAYAGLDRRVELGPDSRRWVGRIALLAVALAAVAGTVAFFATVRSPEVFVAERWDAFKQGGAPRTGSSHFTSLGSNRYDFWRVALDEAESHPLRGIGGRGIYSAYLQNRRSPESPLRSHSLYLDVLAEEGVPGFLLLLAGLGAPLVLLARRLRQPAAVAAFGAAVTFFTHAGVDWVWTVPVVGVPVFLLIGIGCAGDDDRPLWRPASVALAVAGAAAAVLAFAPPWLSYRYVAAAYRAQDPSADLRRARQLDPLSLEPYFAEWRRAATPAAKVAALRGALRIEPRSVAVLYQLGLAELHAGRREAGLQALQKAARLDPHEPAIRTAIRSNPG